MARKTAIVDQLLIRIYEALEDGCIPEINDAVELEMLYLNYKEYEGGKLASKLGLRDANNVRSREAFEGSNLTQNFVNALVQKQIPEQSPSVIKAYTNKQISVARLFGERYRTARSGDVWQLKRFRGELVHKCLDYINGLNRNASDAYIENNVFELLQDITASMDLNLIVKKHSEASIQELEMVKSYITEEKEALDTMGLNDIASALGRRVSRNTFIEDYKLYQQALKTNC